MIYEHLNIINKLRRVAHYYRRRELVGKVFSKFSALIEISKRLPDIVLIADWAGMGDALMYGTIAHELKKRGSLIIEINSNHSELYKGNPDIDILSTSAERRAFLLERLPKNKAISPKYWFGEGNQPDNHILKILCEQAGVSGEIDFRTYIHLTKNELEQVPHFMRDGIVIQSQGKLSWGINKNWYPERFQKVVNYFKDNLPVIQIGTCDDPMLSGCIDMRDRTLLRSAAAILYWSRCFVGQVGGLMHLARAVDTRATIIYGGFEEPWQSGYDVNVNITSKVDCSPCWKMQECLPRKCMDNISSQDVIEAVEKLLSMEKLSSLPRVIF